MTYKRWKIPEDRSLVNSVALELCDGSYVPKSIGEMFKALGTESFVFDSVALRPKGLISVVVEEFIVRPTLFGMWYGLLFIFLFALPVKGSDAVILVSLTFVVVCSYLCGLASSLGEKTVIKDISERRWRTVEHDLIMDFSNKKILKRSTYENAPVRNSVEEISFSRIVPRLRYEREESLDDVDVDVFEIIFDVSKNSRFHSWRGGESLKFFSFYCSQDFRESENEYGMRFLENKDNINSLFHLLLSKIRQA